MLRIIITCLFILCSSAGDDQSLYTDVSLANVTDSLNRISSIPMKVYGFKYDSVADRKQLGILGSDAQRWFPDSVEVVPSHAVPSRNRSEPLKVLKNFPIVNKQVIYMHGLAALQALIGKYADMLDTIDQLRNSGADHGLVFAEIEKRLAKEADEQVIEKRKLLESEALLVQREIELEETRNEEEKRIDALDVEHETQLLSYEESLNRERMLLSQEMARTNIDRSLSLERDLVSQREALRKEMAETLQEKRLANERQFEQEKLENEKNKILSEIEARAEQERLNEDVTIRKLQAQSKADTEKMILGIRTLSQQLSKIMMDLISQPEQLAVVVGILFGLMALYYAIREFTGLARQFVQSRLGRPTLIRETNRASNSIADYIRDKTTAAPSISKSVDMLQDHFKDVILNDEDKNRVIQLALTTRNTKKTSAPFRHVLLYGPPGTGKTMIARKLAECSNMDYAIMSGGDVAPLGEDAVSQLHALFRWAASSRKGLLLFIDEAEAFLSSRTSKSDGEGVGMHIRHALNALLYQTGTQSTTFMLVLATNRPEDLDGAVLDRMDVSHFIGYPEAAERKQLIALYYNVHVASNMHKASVDELTSQYVGRLGDKLKGFSGREIAKLFIGVRYALMLNPSAESDMSLMEATVTGVSVTKINEHNQKLGFVSE